MRLASDRRIRPRRVGGGSASSLPISCLSLSYNYGLSYPNPMSITTRGVRRRLITVICVDVSRAVLP